VNVVLWHVHGSWATSFVQASHRTLVPTLPDRGPDGRGRADTWEWPDRVVEVRPEAAADEQVDVLVAQRLRDLELFEQWFARCPGRHVPTVYVEHNTPPSVAHARHPLADRDDLVIVHVTPFNDAVWDCGSTRTVVIEHGVPDPGYRFTGDIAAMGAVINEPVRRSRVAGTDLLPGFADVAPVHLFGMGTERLDGALATVVGRGDVPQATMLDELARLRCYVHPFRWTSLGLSLIEAMLVGMPVVVLGTTAAYDAVPEGAGVVSTRVDRLHRAASRYVADVELAAEVGRDARCAARARFGLDRFLRDWDRLLEEVTA
jgi:hypothetical protein